MRRATKHPAGTEYGHHTGRSAQVNIDITRVGHSLVRSQCGGPRPVASSAVEEVLRTAPLERVRLGVELWMAAVSDEGGDPHVRLADHLPSPDREVLTAALWD